MNGNKNSTGSILLPVTSMPATIRLAGSALILFLTLVLQSLVGIGSVANAQISTLASSADRVNIEIRHAQNVVPAGEEFRIAILLNLDETWHVNANVPTYDYLIGTEISFAETNGISIMRTQFPEEHVYEFDFSDDPVNVYEGEAPIYMTLAASEALEPGNHLLNMSLRVQACNNSECLAPTTIPLEIPIEVTAAGTGFQPLNQDFFNNMPAATASVGDLLSVSGGGEIAALFNTLGLFWTLVGIFLIGLALNLTPCVYPMLSVTVSLFGGREEASGGSVNSSFAMASVYVLGIVSMYSILGVVAAFTGALFGSWLQSPWVLAGIGALILVLALSMFGLYEIQAPTSWMQKLSGTQRNTTGVVGHFFSGLIVGIFAAPCIGPPIIALLAFVGTQGNPFFGFTIFFVMALGLGLPYLILGTFSGLLGKLPKSGVWMVWVKKVFGVVLTGVALFYLALAFMPAYTLHLVATVLVIGGIYLGFMETSGKDKKVFTRVKWGVGILTTIIGFLIFQNLLKPTIEWEPYDEFRFETSLAENTPVILDFYADWCIPCIELERSTYTDADVILETENFTRLKVDLTQYESEESQSLRERFNIAGVPTVVFIGGNGSEVPGTRVVGFEPAEEFLQKVLMVN